MVRYRNQSFFGFWSWVDDSTPSAQFSLIARTILHTTGLAHV